MTQRYRPYVRPPSTSGTLTAEPNGKRLAICGTYQVQRMITVCVVEDSPDVRKRVVDALREIAGVDIVGEFESAIAAIEGAKKHRPDVVILDDRLRLSSGLDVLRFLNVEYPWVKVIAFSDYAEPYQRDIFLHAGAHAFFSKAEGCEAMLGMMTELAATASQY